MARIEKKMPNGRNQEREDSETISTENRLNEALLSSQTRLQIAELISRRPRTLRELARLTRMSVPGVLRHIEAMGRAGLINEERVEMRTLPARKLYSLKGIKVMDFSVGDLTILKVAFDKPQMEKNTRDLESIAMEVFVGRRRIKEKVRRLARAVDELLVNEEMLAKGINSLRLSDEERLVLLTTFTEDTADEAEKVLVRIQGMREARKSIDEALAKARRNVGK